jgi:hypothetical protein
VAGGYLEANTVYNFNHVPTIKLILHSKILTFRSESNILLPPSRGGHTRYANGLPWNHQASWTRILKNDIIILNENDPLC